MSASSEIQSRSKHRSGTGYGVLIGFVICVEILLALAVSPTGREILDGIGAEKPAAQATVGADMAG